MLFLSGGFMFHAWSVILVILFLNFPLFSQGMVHVRTPIQWMDTIEMQILAVIEESSVNLYFSDGESYNIPLPKIPRTEIISPQITLTEKGIEWELSS
jgi:hypothetical protein